MQLRLQTRFNVSGSCCARRTGEESIRIYDIKGRYGVLAHNESSETYQRQAKKHHGLSLAEYFFRIRLRRADQVVCLRQRQPSVPPLLLQPYPHWRQGGEDTADSARQSNGQPQDNMRGGCRRYYRLFRIYTEVRGRSAGACRRGFFCRSCGQGVALSRSAACGGGSQRTCHGMHGIRAERVS